MMDVHDVQRQVHALTAEQLDVVVAYAHGYCPEAIEMGLALEARSRPQPAKAGDDEGRCECGDPQDIHADAVATPCLRGGCGCTVFRLAAPKAASTEPASVTA